MLAQIEGRSLLCNQLSNLSDNASSTLNGLRESFCAAAWQLAFGSLPLAERSLHIDLIVKVCLSISKSARATGCPLTGAGEAVDDLQYC